MVQLGLVLIGISSVHAVKLLQTSTLHARVYPATAAENVWAIYGNDSVRMEASADGHYYLVTVHPGSWELKVQAKKPYKSLYIKQIDLLPGMENDLGEFTLTQ